jgi:hypothetical protein|tara:strand:+ start:4359 stop:4529 length:171 start_codon:yes stop_codon:yes gene_type:complete
MLQEKNLPKNKRKGLSGGVRYGPPPKKGPCPQGLTMVGNKYIELGAKSAKSRKKSI